MDTFALETPKERAAAFTEAAARMGVQPMIVEKDFWVCWILKRVFSLPEPAAGLIFKGGTSLSKGYGVIDRFSEDIDLSLDRHDLGFTGDRDPANPNLGSNQRKRLLKELTAQAEGVVGKALKDQLTEVIAASIDGSVFNIAVDDTDKQTLLFTYPESLKNSAYTSEYIKPMVRLEFGARSDHLPAETRTIIPYVQTEIPNLLPSPSVEVKILGAERTFWEKATILHWLYHRDTGKPLGERMSRHYYDLARLIDSDINAKALADLSLLETVATHKSIFFRAGDAHYDTAKPGSLRLSPHEQLERVLRTDYKKMAEMIFGDPPSFDDILRRINVLETNLNRGA